MDLIKCPRCGEMYSASYRTCPFCEEERVEKTKKAATRRSGHRVSEKKRTYSARGPIILVLLLVLLILSWYLFGEGLTNKLRGEADEPDGPQQDITDPNDPVDPIEPTDPDEPTPPVVDDPEPDEPGQDDPPESVDPANLSMKTNVGSLQKDPGSGNYDCTIKMTDAVRLIVEGTDAEVSWSSADVSVVTVSAEGKLTPLKEGMTTVTASVGGATVACIVRVKG